MSCILIVNTMSYYLFPFIFISILAIVVCWSEQPSQPWTIMQIQGEFRWKELKIYFILVLFCREAPTRENVWIEVSFHYTADSELGGLKSCKFFYQPQNITAKISGGRQKFLKIWCLMQFGWESELIFVWHPVENTQVCALVCTITYQSYGHWDWINYTKLKLWCKLYHFAGLLGRWRRKRTLSGGIALLIMFWR